MKAYSADLQAALLEGEVISAGAVKIKTALNPARVWSGRGPLTLDGEEFTGIGQAGLVSVSGGQLGAAAQAIELSLSGLDAEAVAVLAEVDIRGAPVVIWRLFYNATGSTLLDAHVFARGRVDTMPIEDTPGGTAKIICRVETAARGLGRQTGRMRADADQRLISGTDGAFRWVTAAPSRQLAWGGKPPSRAGDLFPNGRGLQDILTRALPF